MVFAYTRFITDKGDVIMKLKHWQGYGTVVAKKISYQKSNDIITLKIRVTGNHGI